jgi:hypothetical protein
MTMSLAFHDNFFDPARLANEVEEGAGQVH